LQTVTKGKIIYNTHFFLFFSEVIAEESSATQPYIFIKP